MASQAKPDVFLLPWSVPDPTGFGDLDPGVLARRLPHVLHLLVNSGETSPTGLLEVQSPPDEGPPRWVTLDEPVDAQEALELLPEGEEVRAIVTGVLTAREDGLSAEIWLHFARDGGTRVLRSHFARRDPAAGLRDLAERFARNLDVPGRLPGPALLTSRGDAFYKFLLGLDGAALLTGDFGQAQQADGEKLLEPFADALALDPTFGLALRTAHMTLAGALEGSRIGAAACYRALDRCFRAHPDDGEGCVAVAEHLAVLGDEHRAQEWLEHASHLEPPPARGLESLGILFANRGETVAARDLWLRGVAVDGHPDFFAHLARLAFADEQVDDAWDKVLRGLRRMLERAQRAAEFDDDGPGSGLLLRYLAEHLEDEAAPPEVAEALADLAGVFADGDARIELGLCLHAAGERGLAQTELRAGLAVPIDRHLRDLAVRAMLSIEVQGFERRFTAAVEDITSGNRLAAAIAELESLLSTQSAFWPARYFLGLAERRRGNTEAALAHLVDVLELSPSQPDALAVMGDLLAARGEPEQALACLDEALRHHDGDASLHAARARHLHALKRVEEARVAIERAIALDPDEREYRLLRTQMT